jgi:hypothetical protein
MKQDRFDELMNDATETFRAPPTPDYDAMWKSIERKTFTASTPAVHRSTWNVRRVSAIAATLVVGILLGRASMSIGHSAAAADTVKPITVAAAKTDSSADAPFDVETSRYLGQTAALLIALPSSVKPNGADTKIVARASELLTRTRLLMDSPAASDPQMRSLLEDLELVLAQVVRLQDDKSTRTDMDLIRRALEQRDVIPRLRTAAADISAD